MTITLNCGPNIVIEDCEDAWTVSFATSANVDTDKKVGTYSVKMVCGANLAGKILAYETISSTDIHASGFVGCWMKSSIDLAAGDLKLLLDDASPPVYATSSEVLSFPALVANTWKYCVFQLVNPAIDTALLSVGVYCVNNKAAMNLFVDQITCLLSRDYEALNVIGFDKAEAIINGPAIVQRDLAGVDHEFNTWSKRKISVDLDTLVDDALGRLFIIVWMRSTTRSLTYLGETIEVSLEDNSECEISRAQGLDFAHSPNFTVLEKTPWINIPASLMVY